MRYSKHLNIVQSGISTSDIRTSSARTPVRNAYWPKQTHAICCWTNCVVYLWCRATRASIRHRRIATKRRWCPSSAFSGTSSRHWGCPSKSPRCFPASLDAPRSMWRDSSEDWDRDWDWNSDSRWFLERASVLGCQASKHRRCCLLKIHENHIILSNFYFESSLTSSNGWRKSCMSGQER